MIPGTRYFIPWYIRIRTGTARVVNRKPRVVFFDPIFIGLCQPKTDFLKSVFRLPQKTETEKPTVFLGRFFSHVPYVKNVYISVWKPRYGWTHGQLRHTAAQQQQQQQQRKGAVVGVGRLNVYLLHSLQYYRQVHNPLMLNYWFSCMFRLSVNPLPKMNSEIRAKMGLLFVFGMCYVLPGIIRVMCYQVPCMCYVFRGAVVRDAWWSVSMRFFAR